MKRKIIFTALVIGIFTFCSFAADTGPISFKGGRMVAKSAPAVVETVETVEAAETTEIIETTVTAETVDSTKEINLFGGTQEISPASKDNKISLDIKGMSIVDLLKMISLRAGVNIVVGNNVKGTVSMFLRDVDIWDAFEIILLANDLAYIEEENGIINVMAQRDYEDVRGEKYKDKKNMEVVKLKYVRASDIESTLDKVKTDIGKIIVDSTSNSVILLDTKQGIERMKKIALNSDILLETKVFGLNYATVDDVSDAIGEIISSAGKVSFDTRTNKIVITDSSEIIDQVANVIYAFDEKPRQVLIDAQIIELRPSKTFKMGIDWDYFMSKYFRVQGPFPAPVSAESGDSSPFTFGTIDRTVAAKHDWSVIADALETLGDVKLLSSPRIMALDGKEAKILVGTKQPYLTSKTTPVGDSAQTSFNFETVDVGIQLHVTPSISREGYVSMLIKPVVSSSEYENLGTEDEPRIYPVETTSEIETSVLIKEGTTIIIGGLRKEEKQDSQSRIPILGKLPLLKYVFGNTTRESSVSDLVVLLTPHIMKGDKAFTDFSQVTPDNGAVWDMRGDDLHKTNYSNQ